MKYSVKHANKIIAISEATKDDLLKLYGAKEKDMSVIYHGFDREKYYVEKLQNDSRLKDISPYIYFIGRLEAKKNITTLVKAFALLKQDKTISHKLVLAGRPGYQYEEIKEVIDSQSKTIKNEIIELGYVPDTDAPVYMRNADIFAFPSNFEGFGMPLVEAMASGVPVVASNTTSIPEIVSDAGLLHDVRDEKDLAKNLKLLIKDKKIYDKYVKAGLERSREFSWQESAEKTLDAIIDLATN